MEDQDRPNQSSYPHGRGYGHDYMRGGEVLGGYGYSERDEYERRRGEHGGTYNGEERRAAPSTTAADGPDGADLS